MYHNCIVLALGGMAHRLLNLAAVTTAPRLLSLTDVATAQLGCCDNCDDCSVWLLGKLRCPPSFAAGKAASTAQFGFCESCVDCSVDRLLRLIATKAASVT